MYHISMNSAANRNQEGKKMSILRTFTLRTMKGNHVVRRYRGDYRTFLKDTWGGFYPAIDPDNGSLLSGWKYDRIWSQK